MKVLTVPQWSFGRDRRLLAEFQDLLSESGCQIHFCQSDVDHNRTVTAFSGDAEAVFGVIPSLARAAFDVIDLNHHIGVHPRIGALDVCPFIPLETDGKCPTLDELTPFVDALGESLAREFGLPVYRYELSDQGRHEADLMDLRQGGFGGLFYRSLWPDWGPNKMHPALGVTMIGVRKPLLAINVNFKHDDGTIARRLARQIRQRRQDGDPRFLGVRSMGFVLGSKDMTQVNLNLTMPDLTPVDPIVDYLIYEAALHSVIFSEAELIGVIRPKDMPTASHLRVRSEQIVEGME